jgi:thiamine transport system ATP-binding protein
VVNGLSVTDAVVTWQDEDGTSGTAVDRVSLRLAPGEVLGILGASGSGKSSLLRAIAGLDPLDAGTISWNGVDLRTVPVHKRGFALMFQDGQLFPHRDVAANVGYPIRLARGDLSRVSELLDLVGLSGFERRRIPSLSGGEQQRVALARALAASPRLLLLDEPLSALDRELRERLAGDLARILRETGATTIMVTHDQHEVFEVADRVAVMFEGRIVAEGTREELVASSERVARFLGS